MDKLGRYSKAKSEHILSQCDTARLGLRARWAGFCFKPPYYFVEIGGNPSSLKTYLILDIF